VIGVAGCIYLGVKGKQEASNSGAWRWLASIATIFAFYIVVLNIFQPISGQQSAALITLLVALFYVLGGIWIGARLTVTGIGMAALTLVGYYLFPAYFFFWMAVVGGGALMLAGLWLRTA
jgi:predicted transporter